MGISERKEREKQEMRDRIIEAATKMFIEDGYEKTSIRNIAEQIEYSPATIYLYFKDKDELFFAIHDEGFQKLLKEIEKVKNIAEPLERLREMGRVYIKFAFKNPEYYDLMFIMRAPINAIKERPVGDQCWVNGETTFALLVNTIVECIEKNLIRSTNPMLTSMYTWSSLHGMVSLHIRERYGALNMPAAEINEMLYMALDELIKLMKG